MTQAKLSNMMNFDCRNNFKQTQRPYYSGIR